MFVRTQVKGLLWYNPKVFTGSAPATWDDLLAIQPPSGTKLFCAAFESGDASGWPASLASRFSFFFEFFGAPTTIQSGDWPMLLPSQ